MPTEYFIDKSYADISAEKKKPESKSAYLKTIKSLAIAELELSLAEKSKLKSAWLNMPVSIGGAKGQNLYGEDDTFFKDWLNETKSSIIAKINSNKFNEITTGENIFLMYSIQDEMTKLAEVLRISFPTTSGQFSTIPNYFEYIKSVVDGVIPFAEGDKKDFLSLSSKIKTLESAYSDDEINTDKKELEKFNIAVEAIQINPVAWMILSSKQSSFGKPDFRYEAVLTSFYSAGSTSSLSITVGPDKILLPSSRKIIEKLDKLYTNKVEDDPLVKSKRVKNSEAVGKVNVNDIKNDGWIHDYKADASASNSKTNSRLYHNTSKIQDACIVFSAPNSMSGNSILKLYASIGPYLEPVIFLSSDDFKNILGTQTILSNPQGLYALSEKLLESAGGLGEEKNPTIQSAIDIITIVSTLFKGFKYDLNTYGPNSSIVKANLKDYSEMTDSIDLMCENVTDFLSKQGQYNDRNQSYFLQKGGFSDFKVSDFTSFKSFTNQSQPIEEFFDEDSIRSAIKDSSLFDSIKAIFDMGLNSIDSVFRNARFGFEGLNDVIDFMKFAKELNLGMYSSSEIADLMSGYTTRMGGVMLSRYVAGFRGLIFNDGETGKSYSGALYEQKIRKAIRKILVEAKTFTNSQFEKGCNDLKGGNNADYTVLKSAYKKKTGKRDFYPASDWPSKTQLEIKAITDAYKAGSGGGSRSSARSVGAEENTKRKNEYLKMLKGEEGFKTDHDTWIITREESIAFRGWLNKNYPEVAGDLKMGKGYNSVDQSDKDKLKNDFELGKKGNPNSHTKVAWSMYGNEYLKDGEDDFPNAYKGPIEEAKKEKQSQSNSEESVASQTVTGGQGEAPPVETEAADDTPEQVVVNPKDINRRFEEINYGRVGTFLRATIIITPGERVAENISESRIRKAIRKLILENEFKKIGDLYQFPQKNVKASGGLIRGLFVSIVTNKSSEDKLDNLSESGGTLDQELVDFINNFNKTTRKLENLNKMEINNIIRGCFRTLANDKTGGFFVQIKDSNDNVIRMASNEDYELNKSPILVSAVQDIKENLEKGILNDSHLDGLESDYGTMRYNPRKGKSGSEPEESKGSEETSQAEVNVETDVDLNKVINDIVAPDKMGRSAWGLFASFDRPNEILYAVCLRDLNNVLVGQSYPVDYNTGATAIDFLGAMLPGTDQSLIETALNNIFLKSFSDSGYKFVYKERVENPESISANWNSSTNFRELGDSYQDFVKDIKSGEFENKNIKDNIDKANALIRKTGSRKRAGFGLVNAVGVLRGAEGSESTSSDTIERFARENVTAYGNIIRKLASQLSYMGQGTKVSFKAILKRGNKSIPEFRYTSDDKKAAGAIKGANIDEELGKLLRLSDKMGSSRKKTTIANEVPDLPGVSSSDPGTKSFSRKAVIVPMKSEDALAFAFDKNDPGFIGVPDEDYFKSNGKMLPELNKSQFFAFLIDYYRKKNNPGSQTTNRGLTKNFGKFVRQARRDLNGKHSQYIRNYNNAEEFFLTRYLDANKVSVYRKEKNRIRNNQAKSNETKFITYEENNNVIVNTYFMNRKTKSEFQSDPGFDRKLELEFVYQPGLTSADIYTSVLKDIIKSGGGNLSAAGNTGDSKEKVVVSEAKFFKNLYMKEEKRQLKSLLVKEVLKKKIKKKLVSKILNENEEEEESLDFTASIKDPLSVFDMINKSKESKAKKLKDKLSSKEVETGSKEDTQVNPVPVTPGPKEEHKEEHKEEDKRDKNVVSDVDFSWVTNQPLDTLKVTSLPGNRKHPETGEVHNHSGIDFSCPKETRIRAIAGGTATFFKMSNEDKAKSGASKGFNKLAKATGINKRFKAKGLARSGNMMKIDHGNGYVSAYLHLSDKHPNTGPVNGGEEIALSGDSGSSTGPHLHLSVYKDGVNVTPEFYDKFKSKYTH